MRGLETLAGLWNTANRSFSAAPFQAKDKPRYPHRGLMVDTARHFLPVSVLLQHLEAMSAAKMNVLHWHLTDTQSWPIILASLPLAASAGAFDFSLATYSAADVATVVTAAGRRGIRVIPELDMPGGHFSSILKGYPQFGANITKSGAISQNLDPTNTEMWHLLDGMFAELAGLFPDQAIHVGFDEVDLQGWNTTAILKWMDDHQLKELKDVESYFLNRIRAIAAKYGKRLVIWDDPVGEDVLVNTDTALQVWNAGMNLVSLLSQKGYSQVYSSPFYLDALANSWQDIYTNQDLEIELPGVLGAEACMWGEMVDETNAISRVWPRTAALAEVLWSPGYDSYPRFPAYNSDRLLNWRCNIRTRGVPAEPVYGYNWCPRYPH